MKVRHKQTTGGYGYEVVGESQAHYLVTAPHINRGTGVLAFSKDEYEPIPTETWRDVTGECEFESYQLVHGDEELRILGQLSAKGYRLRKVRVWNGDGATHSMDAFIVEKREP